MTVRELIHTDLLVARRSGVARTVVVGATLAFLVGVLVGRFLGGDADSPASFRFQMLTIWLTAGLIVPLAGVLVGAGSVAGERDDQTLRLLATLPIRTHSVVYGKYIARLLVLEAGVVVGLVAATLLLLSGRSSIEPGQLAGFALFTMLVVASYVAIGVGISTRAGTTVRAWAGAMIVFIGTVAWPRAVELLSGAAGFGDSFFVTVLARLTPFGAYSQVVSDSGAVLFAESSSPLVGSGAMAFVILLWTVGSIVAGREWLARSDV